jgi:hypothetical protein
MASGGVAPNLVFEVVEDGSELTVEDAINASEAVVGGRL